jgi:hypothetical protein
LPISIASSYPSGDLVLRQIGERDEPRVVDIRLGRLCKGHAEVGIEVQLDIVRERDEPAGHAGGTRSRSTLPA